MADMGIKYYEEIAELSFAGVAAKRGFFRTVPMVLVQDKQGQIDGMTRSGLDMLSFTVASGQAEAPADERAVRDRAAAKLQHLGRFIEGRSPKWHWGRIAGAAVVAVAASSGLANCSGGSPPPMQPAVLGK